MLYGFYLKLFLNHQMFCDTMQLGFRYEVFFYFNKIVRKIHCVIQLKESNVFLAMCHPKILLYLNPKIAIVIKEGILTLILGLATITET